MSKRIEIMQACQKMPKEIGEPVARMAFALSISVPGKTPEESLEVLLSGIRGEAIQALEKIMREGVLGGEGQ